MAVYKSTYCYPFLNSVDIRISKTSAASTYPVQYLKCKVDTSNKRVTGYKIRLLDGNNTQIFPTDGTGGYISPLRELKKDNMLDIYKSNGINSGINGTYLQIPFFQNYNEQKLPSYNAIYYKGAYTAEHIILSRSLADSKDVGISLLPGENLDNWYVDTSIFPGENCLVYNWGSATEGYDDAYFIDDDTSKKVDTDYDMYYVEAVTTTTGTVFVVSDDDDEDAKTTLMYAFDRGSNRISLDGEILSSGQIIFVASDSTADSGKTGFYVVRRVINAETSEITTVLRPLNEWNNDYKNATVGHPLIVTIEKAAKFHNTNWEVKNYTTSRYIGDMWCDYDGNTVPNLNMDGNTYKWEITLYQGECETSSYPLIADYQYIENEDLDMVIGSGTICGSYSDRIQIASDDAFNADGTVNSDAIIPGLKSDTLVLQTRYADLSYLSNDQSPEIFSGNRFYIKSYSDSYGYVYPETSQLTSSMVNNATHVQFFKHSNQEEAVLDTDIVDWGTDEQISIEYYGTSTDSAGTVTWTKYDNEKDWMEKVGINNRRLVVDLSKMTGVQAGQKVLLTNQGGNSVNGSVDYSKQNGVYKITDSQGHFCIERAASYTSWSDFIGKVIYVRNGPLGGDNIQSLAQAGTYTIWDPINTSNPGDSGLGFIKEIPILLFQEKLKEGRSYDYYIDDNLSGLTPIDVSINGETLKAGNILLDKQGGVYKVSSIEGGKAVYSAYNKDLQGVSTLPEEGDYVYFTHGKQAQRIYKYSKTSGSQWASTPNWDLYTAKILKNTSFSTYISPSTLLRTGMRLKLTQGNTIVTQENETTSWLQVLSFNQNLYCIHHQVLKNPTVLSSDESSTNNTPWKYEIRSFFKTSDENPFYVNEAPYLTLYKNGLPYTDLAMISSTQQLQTQGGKDVVTSNDRNVLAVMDRSFTDASVVTGRSVKLSAKYNQFQGTSWESYRWVLKNEEGETLQDTGEKYSKEMSVIFYGLANDKENDSTTYYAILYVEDELNNTLQYVVKLSVKQGEPLTLPVPLTATVDCNVQAVKIEYSDNGVITPSYRSDSSGGITEDTDTDYKYYDGLSIFWDGGIDYNGANIDSVTEEDELGARITGKNYNRDIPVEYLGSAIGYGEDRIDYASSLSKAERYGVGYYTYFNKTDTNHDASTEYSLQLQTQKQTNKNELYFETEVTLTDNFCGDIVEWDVQGVDYSGIEDPYITLGGETNDKSGYIEFKLYAPNNLDSTGVNVVEYRNHMRLAMTAYEMSGAQHEKEEIVGFVGGEDVQNLFVTPKNTYYYLQLASEASDTINNENNEYLHKNFENPMYFKRDTNGNYFTAGDKGWGNLCLIKEENDPNKYFTYWVEDRPLLNNPASNSMLVSNKQIQVQQSSDRTKGTENNMLVWGHDSSGANVEENCYWKDEGDDGPITWDEVGASTPGVEKIVPVARHYGMSDHPYHIICRLSDTDALYSALITYGNNLPVSEEQLELKTSDGTVDTTKNGIRILLGNEGIYGSIEIIKMNITEEE